LNNPDARRIEIPSANAVCTARGLAQSFNGVVMGKVLNKETLDYVVEPKFFDGADLFSGGKRAMKLGFNFVRMEKVKFINCTADKRFELHFSSKIHG
jgi:hypothetical protein